MRRWPSATCSTRAGSALQHTGHGHDTILWGEFAAHGYNVVPPFNSRHLNLPGDYGQTKPLQFVRALYCLDTKLPAAARQPGQGDRLPDHRPRPRGASAASNPALFSASGVSDHPYANTQSPVNDGRPTPTSRPSRISGRLGAGLDQLGRVPTVPTRTSRSTTPSTATSPTRPHADRGGSIRRRPRRPCTSTGPSTSATRTRGSSPTCSTCSRTRRPPQARYAGFASGLETYDGAHKATFDAYRLPVYMPRTSFSRSQSVEVWGAARPAPFASIDGFTPASADPAQRGGTWTTRGHDRHPGGNGYFDVHVEVPGQRLGASGSGPIPTDSLLPAADSGQTIHSRTFSVKVH